MIHKYRIQVLVASIFLFTFAASLYAKEDARLLYDRANSLEEKLKGSAQQKQISEWKKAVESFRKVYYTYPTSAYCDNSLFHVGALYAEMAARFNDTLYFH